MGHRKWSQEKGCGLFSAEVNEHNALYDAWEVERERADDLLKDRNAIQQKLDEAALAPLFAAGPWRTDVENAPKAESCIVAFVIFCGTGDLVSISVAHLGDDGIWCHSNGGRRINRIIAFATIYPPEIEG